MAFAQTELRQHAISEMNVTPLVDVMLVMLVIFMITAPMLTREIPLNLGTAPPITTLIQKQPIELRINGAGEVFFAGQPVPASALPSLFSAEIERSGEQSPSLVLDASGEADYQVVAKVLATAQNAGLTRIKFE